MVLSENNFKSEDCKFEVPKMVIFVGWDFRCFGLPLELEFTVF